MQAIGTTVVGGLLNRLLSGFFGAGLVFVLSPVLLFLAGSSPEGEAYANLEFGFSLLALAGASGCVAGLISNAYRLLEVPFPIVSPLVRLPARPEPARGERPEARERVLPVLAPSLVLPTLISGLGGWVDAVASAPRAEARPYAA